MVVLLVEPEKVPRAVEIDGSLSSMQGLVGGDIRPLYPFADDVALICNDEGKMLGMKLNRQLKEMETVIAGSFFLCGIANGAFQSLSIEQIDRYRTRFRYPELFLETKTGYLSINVPDGEEELSEATVFPYRTNPGKKR